MRRQGVLVALVLIVPVLALGIGYLVFRDELQRQAVPPEPPLTQVVDDAFDVYDLEAWPLQPGWQYIARVDYPGMAFFALDDAAPLTYGGGIYGDVAAEVTLWAGAGQCRMSLRSSEAGAYTLALGADNLVTLYRGETEMGSDIASAILSGPPWHRLRLSVMGNVLRVAIDGEEGISVTDPDPLPPGEIVFSLGGESPRGCTIAHFSLWVPAE